MTVTLFTNDLSVGASQVWGLQQGNPQARLPQQGETPPPEVGWTVFLNSLHCILVLGYVCEFAKVSVMLWNNYSLFSIVLCSFSLLSLLPLSLLFPSIPLLLPSLSPSLPPPLSSYSLLSCISPPSLSPSFPSPPPPPPPPPSFLLSIPPESSSSTR